MDKLEEANSRLLARREQLKENTQTSSTQQLTTILTIPEIQKRFDERAKNVREWAAITARMELDKERLEADRKRDQWKVLRESKQKNFIAYLEVCGVPLLFMHVPYQTTEKDSFFVTGACGAGKTHVAIGMLKHFVKLLPCENFKEINIFTKTQAIFITVPELLMKIRRCFSLNECEETIVNKYSGVPFLVLDDLGVEKTSDWALQTLYIIINNRYSKCLQTVITSNFTIEEIGEKLGDRIASRIAGMCKIMKLTGKDRRLKNG